MANIQISGLTPVTSLTSGDVFALDQSVGNLSKKITTANLAAAIVTTTNVTAAGALMDSELTSIADVKALDQSVVSGAAPVFDATNFTNLPSATPSGSDTQIQFNDSGAFGASAGATYSNGLTLTAQATTHKPLILSLAPAQTSSAFEINSFGGSVGDRFRIESNGNTHVGGTLFRVSAGANPITLGYGIGGTTYGGLWLGTGTPSSSNYSFLAGVGQTFFNAEGSGIGDLEFRVANATKFAVGVNGISVFGGINIAPTIPLSVNNSTGTSRLFSILDGGNVGIGTTTPTAQLHTTVGLAATVAHKIDLANAQTANAFEINSFGGSGGDLFRVEYDGAIATNSTVDGRDIATDGAKLDGIEANADVTDVINVTAAGALMDSELTSIADVKALNQSLVIGAAPVLDATNMTNIPSGGILIGDSIGGATNNTVLYADLSGNLWSNSKFTFDGGSLNFTGNSTTSITSTSFGGNAGSGNTGLRNTSIGYQANSNSTGGNITSIGYRAGGFAGSADDSEFIGYEAGYNGSGNRVVFIGYKSGYSYSAVACVGVGDHSLYDTHGIQNVAIGTNSQNSSGTGAYNTSVGHNSLISSANKSNNSALGWSAGSNNTGNDILALGYNAGKSNTQSNRTIIGQSNLPVFSGESAAAAVLPAASPNGVYLYWDDTDNTIKARP